MRLDPNPVFRKVIIPRHDSETLCYAVIVFMLFVVAFGIAGIYTALSIFEYREYVWVPVMLVLMSGGVMLSITIRLVKKIR